MYWLFICVYARSICVYQFVYFLFWYLPFAYSLFFEISIFHMDVFYLRIPVCLHTICLYPFACTLFAYIIIIDMANLRFCILYLWICVFVGMDSEVILGERSLYEGEDCINHVSNPNDWLALRVQGGSRGWRGISTCLNPDPQWGSWTLHPTKTVYSSKNKLNTKKEKEKQWTKKKNVCDSQYQLWISSLIWDWKKTVFASWMAHLRMT